MGDNWYHSACRVAAIVLALALAPGNAFSAGTLTLQFENDILAGTDRHYTNGIRVGWVTDAKRPHLAWARGIMSFLYPFAPSPTTRLGFTAGQSIFTPEDLRRSDLIVDDRPYAGWLYGGLSLMVETTQRLGNTDLAVLDTIELDIGVVGPLSAAKETQQLVHNIIGAQRPNGWANQLHNEPAVALAFERKWRTPSLAVGRLALDAVPGAGLSLGNVDTSATIGTLVRIGEGLGVDHGPPQIRPGLAGAAFHDRVENDLAWYGFVGVSGRAVAHTIFLDGNTFADSHRVDKRRAVGEIQAGVVLVFSSARLSFTWTLRSKEFDTQSTPDRFGAISLSIAL